MKPDYYKLLLQENVVPAKDANWMHTGLDLVMMSVFATEERVEES